MITEKTEKRYLDYLILYTNIIWDYSEELKKMSKKKRSGEATIEGKKHMYFAGTHSITIMNKKTHIEMSFVFNTQNGEVYFEKLHLHNFIESDLNASWLGKNFSTNSTCRWAEYDECLDVLCKLGKIQKKDKGFIISHDEIN